VVYLGDRAGDLHAIDAVNGKSVWSVHLDAPISKTVAIKDGKLAVAAEDLSRGFSTATSARSFGMAGK